MPPARPASRPEFFPVPPAGPGYYSLTDALSRAYRESPPRHPYPRFALMPTPFFDAAFHYLDDPNHSEVGVYDPLKRVRLGDDWLSTTGGEARSRYTHEYNSRLAERTNTYKRPA